MILIISTANGLFFLACVVMVVNFRKEYTRKKAEIEAGSTIEKSQKGKWVFEKTISLSKSQLNKQRLDNLRLGNLRGV